MPMARYWYTISAPARLSNADIVLKRLDESSNVFHDLLKTSFLISEPNRQRYKIPTVE